MAIDVRAGLEPLELLDLRRRRTVGEIVDGMRRCSFGARMLGEVAATLTKLASGPEKPVLVCDGKPDTPLGRCLQWMFRDKRWFGSILTPREYAQSRPSGPIVVVGNFSERYEDALFDASRAIFINADGRAKPGQVRDGHFPDAVFADPRFVIPLLELVLRERLEDRPVRVTELFDVLALAGGVAEETAHGARTLRAMVEDPDCTVCLTLSGAMTIAKMGLVICDMIDLGMVQYIAATGALMAHGLVESVGLQHFKYDPVHSDEVLAAHKLNRVTDTIEPEENLDQVEEVLDRVLDEIDGARPIGSHGLHRLIGAHLAAKYPNERGILKSAYEKDVPVVVPAFADSELGNDLYIHNERRRRAGRPPVVINSELDSRLLVELAVKAKKRGIFTIGGGVARNNTQNSAPLIDILNQRLGLGYPPRMFTYGCRICPDPMHLGHLSGSTYKEGISWHKIDPTAGRRSEIHADATQIWPFLVRYVMDCLEK